MHVRLTLHPLARTVHVLSNVRRHNNSASLFWLRHCFHRLSSIQHTRRHECMPQRMFAWLTVNTMLRVPYRTDSDTVSVTVRYQAPTKALYTFLTYKLQRNPLDSFQNNPRKQVSVKRSHFSHPERITRPERLLSEWVEVTLIGSASSQ